MLWIFILAIELKEKKEMNSLNAEFSFKLTILLIVLLIFMFTMNFR